MDGMKKIRIHYRPQDFQKEIHQSQKRFRVVKIGRRGGKSELALNELIKKSIKKKGLYWYIAPSYRQAKMIAWNRLKDLLSPARDFWKFNEQELTATEMNIGTTISLKGADNEESLLGVGLDGVVLDECAMIKDGVWERIIRPMLIDTKGWALFISTPKGKNWFYDIFIKQDEDWQSWGYSTSINKYIDPKEIEEARKGLSERLFKQEILAEFLDDETGVFKGISQVIGGIPEEPRVGEQYVTGIDLAKTYDFTALCTVSRKTRQVVSLYRCQDVRWTDQKLKIQDESFKYNNSFCVIDSTGVGDPIVEDLQSSHIPMYYEGDKPGYKITSASKTPLISNLQIAIEQRLILIPREFEVLIKELREYELHVSDSGNITYSAPDGKNDDCLKEGTLIKTLYGYKPIEDVDVGEYVLTHKNRYRRVVKSIKKKFSGEWHNLKFIGQLGLGLSYNHPIYCAKARYEGKRRKEYSKRDWVLPSDIKKDYKCVSLVEKLDDNCNNVIKDTDLYELSRYEQNNKLREIKLDSNFARFLGLFLAEGNVRRFSDKDYVCSVAFNKNNSDLICWVRSYLEGLGVKTSDRFYGDSNAFALIFSSKLLATLLRDCYDDFGEKKLPKYHVFLGKDLKYVLEYWLKGDGWKHNKGYVIGATTSKSLGLSMRDIAIATGNYSLIRKIKRHRYGNPTKDQYWVEVHTKDAVRRQETFSDFEYGSRCSKHEVYNYDGYVYNLQVEEDESFVADGIVVHNCVIALALAVWALRHEMRTAQVVKRDEVTYSLDKQGRGDIVYNLEDYYETENEVDTFQRGY